MDFLYVLADRLSLDWQMVDGWVTGLKLAQSGIKELLSHPAYANRLQLRSLWSWSERSMLCSPTSYLLLIIVARSRSHFGDACSTLNWCTSVLSYMWKFVLCVSVTWVHRIHVSVCSLWAGVNLSLISKMKHFTSSGWCDLNQIIAVPMLTSEF